MGANARRRREERARRQGTARIRALVDQLLRCSSCGSDDLRMLLVEPSEIPDPREREGVARLLEWADPDADVWMCGTCGQFSATGSFE